MCSLQLSVTLAQSEDVVVDRFLEDIRKAIVEVKANPQKYHTGKLREQPIAGKEKEKCADQPSRFSFQGIWSSLSWVPRSRTVTSFRAS
jgi:hypothetical protein